MHTVDHFWVWDLWPNGVSQVKGVQNGALQRQADLQGVFENIGDFPHFKGSRAGIPEEEALLTNSTPRPQKIARKIDSLFVLQEF